LKVRIGSTDYALTLVNEDKINRYFDEEMTKSSVIAGCIHSLMGTIEINDKMPKQARMQSFLHECVHGMLTELGIEDLNSDEGFVDSMAKQLYVFFRDNNYEKIEAYLGEKKGGRTTKNIKTDKG